MQKPFFGPQLHIFLKHTLPLRRTLIMLLTFNPLLFTLYTRRIRFRRRFFRLTPLRFIPK